MAEPSWALVETDWWVGGKKHREDPRRWAVPLHYQGFNHYLYRMIHRFNTTQEIRYVDEAVIGNLHKTTVYTDKSRAVEFELVDEESQTSDAALAALRSALADKRERSDVDPYLDVELEFDFGGAVHQGPEDSRIATVLIERQGASQVGDPSVVNRVRADAEDFHIRSQLEYTGVHTHFQLPLVEQLEELVGLRPGVGKKSGARRKRLEVLNIIGSHHYKNKCPMYYRDLSEASISDDIGGPPHNIAMQTSRVSHMDLYQKDIDNAESAAYLMSGKLKNTWAMFDWLLDSQS